LHISHPTEKDGFYDLQPSTVSNRQGFYPRLSVVAVIFCPVKLVDPDFDGINSYLAVWQKVEWRCLFADDHQNQ
jgi:hypothetical protein